MKKYLFLILFTLVIFSCKKEVTKFPLLIKIPTASNTWVKTKDSLTLHKSITNNGIKNWSNNTLRTYFYIHKATEISLGLDFNNLKENIYITANFNGEFSKEIKVSPNNNFIGNFTIKKAGYYYLELHKNNDDLLDFNHVLVGISNKDNIDFSRDDYYWSHRGPSTHLNYQIPKNKKDVEYYYSEIIVPKENDIVGTFYMANGFQHGYFGIQVNSETERRILFSVWSPYKTDDPSSIPEEYRIKLLKKGTGVTTGKFGNEGSGGQSYKVFNWKSDTTYKFLLKATPFQNNTTNFTAYFFDSEIKKWHLIASFNRPKTQEYLKRFHGFLENFIPSQGSIERKAFYTNQWVYNKEGWHEINEFKFSADNTARKKNRLDYAGGVIKNKFYLKGFGFFNTTTKIGTLFNKDKTNQPPKINFKTLE